MIRLLCQFVFFCLSHPWWLHVVVISAVKRSFWAAISGNSNHVLMALYDYNDKEDMHNSMQNSSYPASGA